MKKVIVSIFFLLLFFIGISVVFDTDTEHAEILDESEQENKEVTELITKVSLDLDGKGYLPVGIYFTFDDRMITVQAQNEEFIEQHQKEVEDSIYNVAKELEFQDFDVIFNVVDLYDEKQEKVNEAYSNASKEIPKILKEQGFQDYSLSLVPKRELIIYDDEEDVAEKEQIVKELSFKIFTKTNLAFNVRFSKKN